MSKADTHYPEDEFDVPNPDAARGVHRAPRSAWSRWWPFLAVLVAAPLAAYGLVTLAAHQDDKPTFSSSQEPEASDGPSASPGASATGGTGETPAAPPSAPTVNTSTPVVVLNAAQIAGLAKSEAKKLTDAGFTAVTPGNFTGTKPADSVVYYASEDLAPTAQLVATTLGISTATLSAADAPSGISVVLASDPSA
ncbi:LytR C-terminal domain-containing protein [Cellulomonas sp. URHD0024]|uniref:LytR C-terminal domain-containing protein n=1 Tax=Cellulomonas sp. URHD0024 TaxID=1302620 RepID=UPI00040A5903|nr:LytR C-terminal domain-containing protein [Cellulomonas sp. URHD0024]